MKTVRHLGLLFLFIVGAQNALAHTITVHSAADSGPGSLRQALVDAANGDTININAKLTIYLTSGELVVSKNLTIRGPGANGPTISGSRTSRVFHVMPGNTVTIDGMTITNGAASDDLNSFPDGAGGGIYNDHAKLTVTNCTLTGNSAALGGAIFSNSMDGGSAALTISNTAVSNNSASFAGGGIFSGGGFYDLAPAGSASLVVNNSVITNNSAAIYGGGIFNDGLAGTATLTVTNSTLSGNVAKNSNGFGIGGAIYNNGDSGIATVTITHSDLSRNAAGGESTYASSDGFGGAVYNDAGSSIKPGHADIAITDSSFRDNSAQTVGGAIASFTLQGSTTTIALSKTVLSGNSATPFSSSGAINVGAGGAIECANDRGNASLTVTSCDLRTNSAAQGGGIDIQNVRLEMVNSRVDGNSAPGTYGGGISIDPGLGPIPIGLSRVTMTNCTVNGNSSDVGGGGVFNGGAELHLIGCTISNNSARLIGGGISNGPGDSSVVMEGSTISGNSTTTNRGNGRGGGIFNSGADSTATVTLINSTVTGNSADVGGGIYSHAFRLYFPSGGIGTVKLRNSTLSGNSATFAGGIFTWDSIDLSYDPGAQLVRGIATVQIANSIIDAGTSGENLVGYEGGKVISNGYNLSSDAAGGDNTTSPGGLLNGPGDIRNTHPLLGPLKANGGPTMTHALMDHSTAINAGDPNFNPYLFNPPLLYDQRGANFPRIVGGRVDIGAYEAKHR